MARPLKYTIDEVSTLMDDYFNKTEEKDQTVTGLALIFGSKQLLNDYQSRDGYNEIITRAKLIIENKYEKMLVKPSCAGAIFALKNLGWTDVQGITVHDSVNIELKMLLEKFMDGAGEKNS